MNGEHDLSTAYPQASCDEDWLNKAGAGFRQRLDAAARQRRPDWPERVSPELFNAHVTADLHAVIRGYACFVRLDMAGYAEAMDGCLGYAWMRGAWGLSATHFSELQDWLHQELATAIGPEV